MAVLRREVMACRNVRRPSGVRVISTCGDPPAVFPTMSQHALLADLAALPGCAAITDPGHVRDGLWSSNRPPSGHAPILGNGETWDVDAIQKGFDARLSNLLREDGITWEPGSPAAALAPGMTLSDAAAIWLHALDRMERFLDMVTAQTAAGRQPGDSVRPHDAPAAAWVTTIGPGATPLP